VGFYNDQVLPRFTNVMLGSKPFQAIRDEQCAGLKGDVLEIGFGSGLNLSHLPPEVTSIWTVEPSAVALKLAEKRIEASPADVHVGGLDGERLDFPDDRFDAALSTMTLCTIPDVAAALREVRRVVKPGGEFHFAEHGHAPDDKVARTQARFNKLQNRVAGGCNLNRDIPALLSEAGFEIESMRNFYLKGPKAWGYMYLGVARA
jgi:ubiquinone/menaquinone biosynthesis C-methylase UbiE